MTTKGEGSMTTDEAKYIADQPLDHSPAEVQEAHRMIATKGEGMDPTQAEGMAQVRAQERRDARVRDDAIEHAEEPHTGHYSRIGGTWWCDTCNSPYCEQA